MEATKSINPQHQSSLFSLPVELREKIFAADKSVAQVIEQTCRQGRSDLDVLVQPSEVENKKDIWSVLRKRDLGDVSLSIDRPMSAKNLYGIALAKKRVDIAEEKYRSSRTLHLALEFSIVINSALLYGAKIGFEDVEIFEKRNLLINEVSAASARRYAMDMCLLGSF